MQCTQPSILYVEDEMGIRDELTRFLKRFSRELLVANDGKEGLELYKQYQPDIVISDTRMPQMDGVEMAQQIAAIHKDQFFIFTTAFNKDEIDLETAGVKAYAYIVKPIELDILKQKIEEIGNILNT
jgi:response regulator RpfG family c-di-GMP phosphodiesterase